MSEKASKLSVFLDSDVIISALLSKRGAAYFLLASNYFDFYISNLSEKELLVVCKRLEILGKELRDLIKEFNLVQIGESKLARNDFGKFVTDTNDSHVVSGAVHANVKFIVTYNLKDFKREVIKDELGILIMTPGMFLQYFRSLK